MFKLTFRSMSLALALAGTGATTLGCSEANPAAETEQTGTLSAALTSVGSDGATYSFQLGTYLVVSSASYSESLPLEGPDAVLQKQLPVGSYTASLAYSTPGLVLSRSEGAVTSNVDAAWADPQPVTFEILNGQPTALVLHLTVQGLSDLTFEVGTLQVSAEVVEQDVAQAGRMVTQGSVNFYQEEYADLTADYASALDIELGVDLSPYGLTFQATSDWTQFGGGTLCKYGTIVSTDGGGAVGLSARLGQTYGGSGYVCIYDQGSTDWISFGGSVTGAPPPGQEAMFPNPPYTFAVNGGGSFADVYDGQTLLQSALEVPTAISGGYLGHYIYDSGNTLVTQVWGNSTATLQLLP